MRALLRRLLPPCFSKAILSRGLQHPSALVRHTTLATLSRLLAVARPLLADSDAAAAVAAADAGPVPAGTVDAAEWNSASSAPPSAIPSWASLPEVLRNAIRTQLPDPQVLVKLFCGLEGTALKPHSLPGSAAGAAPGPARGVVAEGAEAMEIDGEEADPEAVKEVGENGGGSLEKGGLGADELIAVELLAVLEFFGRWLPRATVDAHLDALVARLPPQVHPPFL